MFFPTIKNSIFAIGVFPRVRTYTHTRSRAWKVLFFYNIKYFINFRGL